MKMREDIEANGDLVIKTLELKIETKLCKVLLLIIIIILITLIFITLILLF
jgi:hypothetical protein